MAEPRAPLESEVPGLIGFLDKHLRTGMGWSIANEYPQVFNSTNLNNIRIIAESDHVIAHAATKYLHIKNTFGVFKVAAIGSVLTDPEHRNQGLSQKIMQNCLQSAEAEGADFAILWTDLYDLYRKMGFELAGTEVSLIIEQTPVVADSGLRIMKSEKISPDSLLRLYSQHTCTSLRTVEDVRKSLQIPNSQVYTAWDKSNQLQAYAVEGKGADLKGYIHEWGGNVPSLLVLLAHVRNDLKQPITVIAPPSAQNLIRQLRAWGCVCNEGYLGMLRPVHLDNLFFKIRRHARNLGIQNFVIEKSANGFVIGTQDDKIQLNSLGELTRLLFGPIETALLKPEFQKLFPIPMWIWGWDSV